MSKISLYTMDKTSILQELNLLTKDTLMESLGIIFTLVEPDCICADMPADSRTMQPFGIVHGGAFMALAETLGSAGSMISTDLNLQQVVGLEMKGNYLKSVHSGIVHGKATPIHRGRKTHLWNIDITDDAGNLVATCRITNIILDKE